MGLSNTASVVPVAMCCEKPAQYTSAGTMMMPPPMPKIPAARPPAIPIDTKMIQDGI